VRSTSRRRSGRPAAELPRRELLEALARQYHHLQNEHKRFPEGSTMRRRIEARLLDVGERFDRTLDEWVTEDDLRESWRRHLHYRAAVPEGPAAVRPLVFRGISDAGSVVEIRGGKGDDLDVVVDGSLVERIAATKDLGREVLSKFHVDGFEFRETFTASPDALEALDVFLAGEVSPPWEHAIELLADGLIDTHFDLTPRGRRAQAAASS
jgi:hypothetical protein